MQNKKNICIKGELDLQRKLFLCLSAVDSNSQSSSHEMSSLSLLTHPLCHFCVWLHLLWRIFVEASCQRVCWLRREFPLTELGLVLKVFLRHAPFLLPFPGLMQNLSGEAFFCVIQKVQLGDHRGSLLLYPLWISSESSENQGCHPELKPAELNASTESRIMWSEIAFSKQSGSNGLTKPEAPNEMGSLVQPVGSPATSNPAVKRT